MTKELQHEVLMILLVSLGYLVIFGLAELIRKLFPEHKEISRKTVHLLGGLAALALPYLFTSHWSVLVIALGFIGFMVLMLRLKKLQSIFGVERKSYGTLLFPISLYLIFLLAKDQMVVYVVSILVLAISDTIAALIGGRYGLITFKMEKDTKSLEGTLSFFMVTFLCVHLPLLLMTDLPELQTILIGIIIAFLVASFELISLSGTDNLFIPLSTYYVLNRILQHPYDITVMLIIFIPVSIGVMLLIFGLLRWVSWNLKIVIMLLNYGCLALASMEGWFYPLVLLEIYIAVLIIIYRKMIPDYGELFTLKPSLYMVAVPVILLFVPATFDNHNFVFLPFLVSIILPGVLIGQYFWDEFLRVQGNTRILYSWLMGGGLLITSIGFVALGPLYFFNSWQTYGQPVLILILSIGMGWIFSRIISTIHDAKFPSTEGKIEKRYTISLLGIPIAVIISFGLQVLVVY